MFVVNDKLYRVFSWVAEHILCGKLFSIWEHLGFHITPNHFYYPIPDTRKLGKELWLRQSQLVGVNINEKKQIELIGQLLEFKNEYDTYSSGKTSKPWQYHYYNPSFGPVDAEVLYCITRYFRPKKVIEIGSGYSTYILAEAILKNAEEYGYRADLTAIEPYPNKVLKAGFPGLSRLITEKVEEVDLTEFESLEENDILLIDSSHVLKIGGDVYYEYTEILPRLKKGVIVHIHDIFFPSEYPKHWVLNMHRFWNEQYLIQAFLAFNQAFEIIWCGSYMHLRHPDKLGEAFSSYNRATVWSTKRPGATSLWIRKTA
ncbi:MAG: class I SAM-dependent methyltransferase [Dehalococcoidia bacterium]|nr:MAG: class I SAM-dependent methyltransferase [Dehalococcoidia bacterium]